jgi:hypothetical protein
MFHYEIKNKITGEEFTAQGKHFQAACESKGQKAYQCKLIWKARV